MRVVPSKSLDLVSWQKCLSKPNIAGWKMDPDWRCRNPIENCDFPASYVSLPEDIKHESFWVALILFGVCLWMINQYIICPNWVVFQGRKIRAFCLVYLVKSQGAFYTNCVSYIGSRPPSSQRLGDPNLNLNVPLLLGKRPTQFT